MSSTTHTGLIDAAVDYAERLSWPVFPVLPNNKRPHGRLVPHGLKEATTSIDRIRTWWRCEPRCNIGVATGVVFDVLDIDGGDGWTSLAGAIDGEACLPLGPVSLTARGAHYLFEPTGIGNKAGVLPGLDWRGRGGYIVVPPSKHPSGDAYQWATDPDEGLPAVPDWLHRLMEGPQPIRGSGDTQRPRAGNRYAEAALRGELSRIGAARVGTRNHALNRAAFALGQLVAAQALDIDQVWDSLVAAGIEVGLTQKECEVTVESGMTAGLRSPRWGVAL